MAHEAAPAVRANLLGQNCSCETVPATCPNTTVRITPLPLSAMDLSRLRRWPIATAIAGIGISIAVIVVLTVRWFLNPYSVNPDRADAIVVLAGGAGERLDRALELVEQQVADTLVLSYGNQMWFDSEAIAETCDDVARFEVICFEPDPDSTKGEAMTFTRLAEEQGWQTVVLVTSEYHLHRATLRFNRCFDGEVLPVAAPASTRLRFLVHEWLGTIEAETIDRGCS